MSDETYTVKQSALALGISEKRVRQLIQEGKLQAASFSPVMISQVDVLDLRNIRANSPRIREATTAKRERQKSKEELLLEQFSKLLEQVTSNNLKQIEAVAHAQETERANWYRLLSEKDAEISRLSSRRSFFGR